MNKKNLHFYGLLKIEAVLGQTQKFWGILAILMLLSTFGAYSQNAAITDDNTYTPHASAMLDVKSTDKGLLIPRLTEVQKNAISSPADGLMIYQTDGESGFYYYENSAWMFVTNAASVPTSIGDADSDTKILVEETADEDSIKFVVNDTVRWAMFKNRIEAKNNRGSIYIGKDAGKSDLLNYDKENVFIGYESGVNVIRDENVHIGAFSGQHGSEGGGNVLIGYQSGMNTNDDYNTFVGSKSGKSNTGGWNNVFLGYETGQKNTDGDKNTFVGSECAENNTTGNYNVSLGYNSGYNNSTGDGNVFLGYKAGYSEMESDKLYIENTNSSTPLIYGDFDKDSLVFNGDVTVPENKLLSVSKQGIGTSNPDASAALEIKSTTQGFLPPRMTEVQRDAISTPAAGLMVWCTDCGTAGELQAYDGAAWQSLMAAATPVPVVPPVVGDYYQGGVVYYIFQSGDPGYVSGETHGLICAVEDLNNSQTISWHGGTYATTGATATAIGSGQTNTATIVSLKGSGTYAAKVCDDYSVGVYDDWFLPSFDELNLMIQNQSVVEATSLLNGGTVFDQYTYFSSTEDSFYKVQIYSFNHFGLLISWKNASVYNIRPVRYF